MRMRLGFIFPVLAAAGVIAATGMSSGAAETVGDASSPPTPVVEPLATGPGCIIQTDFKEPGSNNGDFEVVVLQGHDLVEYQHDNSQPSLAWRRVQIITHTATSLGPGCLIQSDFKGPSGHGNFEVVVQEGSNLVLWFRNNSDPDFAWHSGGVVAAGVSGPGSIIQSDFKAASGHGDLEVVVPEGPNLFHWFRGDGAWQSGGVVASGVNGAGSIIQSDFKAPSGHGDLEVVVPQGPNLVHWFRGDGAWQSGGVVARGVSGAGSIIQSDFKTPSGHGDLEVVAPQGAATLQSGAHRAWPGQDFKLVHFFHAGANVDAGWQQAQVITYRGRSEKICQLTGPVDKEAAEPTANQPGPAPVATDLGFPIENPDGRMFLLFGDSRPRPALADVQAEELTPDDSIASLTDQAAPTGPHCPSLTFNTENNPPIVSAPTVKPQIDQGLFDVPEAGVALNGALYTVFWTNHCAHPPIPRPLPPEPSPACDHPNPLYDPNANRYGTAELARSADGGHRFAALYQLPPAFVYDAVVDTDQIAGLPPEQRLGVIIWGVPKYRESFPQLAFVPPDRIEDPTAWQFRPMTWSPAPDETAGNTRDGCIGEFSVTRNRYLGKWIMLYNCDTSTEGSVIRARTADAPWGPWSAPATIFNSDNQTGDHGYCHFIHFDLALGCDKVGSGDNLGTLNNTRGFPYAPYVLDRYTTGDGKTSTMYYLMSTWNPYEVVIMKTTFAIPTSTSSGVQPTAPSTAQSTAPSTATSVPPSPAVPRPATLAVSGKGAAGPLAGAGCLLLFALGVHNLRRRSDG